MTDTNTSGASFAPAADTSAPAASAETPAAKFGSTRGSGLARGKRYTSAAAPSGTSATADYKPTSLEVIAPPSEYKNPFASPEPENPPAAEPAKVEVEAEAPAAIVAEPIVEAQVPVADQPPIEREEINILPPAEAVRPAVSWESPSSSGAGSQPDSEEVQRDNRPTFRPDRREDQAGAPRTDGTETRNDGFQRQPRDPRFARQPRDPRDARQPRDPREARQPRDPRDERQPRDPRDERPRYEQRPQRDQNGAAGNSAPAPKGFFGWLKGLFAGPKPAETPAAREIAPEGYGDGHRHRRRHRGGRGHGGNPQGFRPEGGSQQGGEGGDRENRGGDRHGGPRRRRHRGGAGRDRGSNPRSEGSQGGGAI
jgi:translation initiation factor IF-2